MSNERFDYAGANRKKHKKAVSLILSIALLVTLVAGGTLAYVVARTVMTQNQFRAGSISSSVNGNGQVTNNGNADAYIRAAVVVNWMDQDGNVYGIKPQYTLSVNSGWTQIGDYYYYTSAVASKSATLTAPVSVGVAGAAPSDAYTLSIEIVAEAIQAEGTTDDGDIPAYQDAWGISAIGN